MAFAYEGMELGELSEDFGAMVTRKLLDDEVRLALPVDHPRAGDAVAHLKDFETEDWIAGCPRCRGHLLSLAKHSGFAPHVAFETEDYVAVLGLVSEGLGVALVPDLILRAAAPHGIVALPLEPRSRRQIHVVTTPDLERVPAVRATLDALVESAGALPPVPALRATVTA